VTATCERTGYCVRFGEVFWGICRHVEMLSVSSVMIIKHCLKANRSPRPCVRTRRFTVVRTQKPQNEPSGVCVRACVRGETAGLFMPAYVDPCLQANALVIPRWDSLLVEDHLIEAVDLFSGTDAESGALIDTSDLEIEH
jgi:hypothetical protein